MCFVCVNRQTRRLVSANNSDSENDDEEGDDEETSGRIPVLYTDTIYVYTDVS